MTYVYRETSNSNTLPSRTFRQIIFSPNSSLNEENSMTMSYVEDMDETKNYIHNHPGYFSTRMRPSSYQRLPINTALTPILCKQCLNEYAINKFRQR